MCYNIIQRVIYELKNINIALYFTFSSHIYLYTMVKFCRKIGKSYTHTFCVIKNIKRSTKKHGRKILALY